MEGRGDKGKEEERLSVKVKRRRGFGVLGDKQRVIESESGDIKRQMQPRLTERERGRQSDVKWNRPPR